MSFTRLALPLAITLVLTGCGGVPNNPSLYSLHQPEVRHQSVALDLVATPDGLSPAEQQRLAGWFAAMGLRYGDHVAVVDPLDGEATRAGVANVAARFGLLVDARAPADASTQAPGSVRVTLTRAIASVPHCPDWSANSASNPRNGTSSNYGCAVNSNLAAMVANPNDLLKGATDSGQTRAMSADKAIAAWRAAAPGTAKDTETRQ